MKLPIEPTEPRLYKPTVPSEASKMMDSNTILKSVYFSSETNHPLNEVLAELQVDGHKASELFISFAAPTDDYLFGGEFLLEIGKVVKVPNPHYKDQVKNYKKQLAHYNKALPAHQAKMEAFKIKMQEYNKQMKEYNRWENEQHINRLEKTLKKLKKEMSK